MPDLNLTFKADKIKKNPKKTVEVMLSMLYSKCCRKADFSQLMKDFEKYSVDWVNKYYLKREEKEEEEKINLRTSFPRNKINFLQYNAEDAGNCYFDYVEIEENCPLLDEGELMHTVFVDQVKD
jgi:hypothetical protein